MCCVSHFDLPGDCSGDDQFQSSPKSQAKKFRSPRRNSSKGSLVVSPLSSPRNNSAAAPTSGPKRAQKSNVHLKSVQRTMAVSNMQKWMPAFRRLEAKFASSDMTDEEKQDALKV